MFVTLDFETYYGEGVGFSVHTTEEYINHPEFHEIGMGIRVDEGATEWVTGHDAIAARLALIYWDSACVLCHNALFDGAILAWRFGVIPAFYFDTLCMARAIHGVEAGGSLAALASRYGLGQKGVEVANAKGKKLEDFSPEELARYGDYCKNDVDLTLALFVKLSKEFPQMELDLIDMTIRMFTCPTLYVDDALLVERLGQVRDEKQELLGTLMQELDCEYEEGVRAKLSSNPQFADILKQRGVTVPLKTSPATGMETYALAKNDEGFMALQEHEDPIVQQLCAVRLGTKSTLEESRIERFIGIGARNKGRLPIPLKYYGAHTGRWSGLDKVNFQNLPSRDKKKKSLKNSIVAPPGCVIVDCDSSQIEARVLAWWAGQDDVVQAFARKEDIYCQDASMVYGRTITKADPIERFVGKTMRLGLGYGTGAKKLKHTLKTTPPGADPSLEECEGWVKTWRSANSYITTLWRECDQALKYMMSGATTPIPLGLHGVVTVSAEGIRLPNGLYIRYNNLRQSGDKIIYDSRKGPVNIWGGAMVENIVQALARIIVGQQMLWINLQHRVVLTVHDAAMCVVPEEDLTNALEYITLCMSTTPEWAAGLPIACEAKQGTSYGNCK
jgi:DNA polymerase I-like protein with 3'-5' exonuclease and polymerase domains